MEQSLIVLGFYFLFHDSKVMALLSVALPVHQISSWHNNLSFKVVNSERKLLVKMVA